MVEFNSKFVKSKYFCFLVCSFLFLFLSLFDLRTKLFNEGVFSYELQLFVGLVGIILPLLVFSLLFFLERYDVEIEKVFLVLALVLGLIYIVASPLFTGGDEHDHYYRVYEITDGTMVTPVQMNGTIGSQLPKSLYDMFMGVDKDNLHLNYRFRNSVIKYGDELGMLGVELNPNETMQYGDGYFSSYLNTVLYNPVQYLPLICGFIVGKLFGVTPFVLGIFGRLFNLFCFVFLGYHFLNKMPFMKEYCALILLAPAVLSGASTLSADAFINVIIFGFLAYVLYYVHTKNSITTKDSFVFLLFSVFIASFKVVYLPFLFVLFLMPLESYKSKKHKYVSIFCMLFISFVISIVWMKVIGVYLNVYYTNSRLQVVHIFNDLLWYSVVLLRTYLWNSLSFLLNIFGSNDMYHAQLEVYPFLPIIYTFVVIAMIFTSFRTNANKLEKYYYYPSLIFLIVIELVLIATAIYVQFTATFISLDNFVVIGLQGRYYIPLMFLVPFFIKTKDQKINYFALGMALLVNICILMQMVVHFII